MNRDRDWQDTLARILEADTGDLRRLAELAECDPRTFYVGTSLNGSDISGQDLRGMILPDLDLARVRHDDQTRVDAPEIDWDPNAPMIYVSERDVDRTSIAHLSSFTPWVFAPHALEEFIEASSRHEGPVIVIGWDEPSEEGRLAAEALAGQGVRFIILVIETVRKRPILRKAWPRQGPILSVPLVSAVQRPRLFTLTAEALDAIGVLSRLWVEQQGWLRRRDAVFMRSRGVGPDRELDAVAQIYDRAARLGLVPNEVSLVIPEGRRPGLGYEDPARQLVRAEEVVVIPSAWTRPAFDVALIGSVRPGPTSSEYFDAILSTTPIRALRIEGTLAPRPGATVAIVSEDQAASMGRLDDWPDSRSLEPDRVQTCVLSPRADIGHVIDRLAVGELWLNARDLLAVDVEDPSLWLAIAAQLRRLSQAMSDPAKHIFLAMIVRSAFKRDRVRLNNPDPFIEALSRPDFDRTHELSVTHLRIRASETSARLAIRGGWRSTLEQRGNGLKLAIDREGPSLEQA